MMKHHTWILCDTDLKAIFSVELEHLRKASKIKFLAKNLPTTSKFSLIRLEEAYKSFMNDIISFWTSVQSTYRIRSICEIAFNINIILVEFCTNALYLLVIE